MGKLEIININKSFSKKKVLQFMLLLVQTAAVKQPYLM